MGTKFRTMLAPIGLSTGDGRRFAEGAITLADLPMPFEWARSREGGHDGAVVVGAVQEAHVGTVKQALADGWISEAAAKGMDSGMAAVWASGEMLDDADREAMPRLAEDVAEAMHLIAAGTLGPSVDLDSFEATPVFEGSDEPVTWEAIEEYYEEHGEEPKLELLVTEGRVRAATLVSIPAFAETSRPLELIEQDSDELALAASEAEVTALIASVATATALPSTTAFDRPALDGPTPITWDHANGRVFGHIATWRTCHVGYADVCVTAPKDPGGEYAWFNRFAVETDGGTVWAGRITVGGRHAGLELNASGAMSAYDGKTVAAHVRAYEDEHGIVVAGVIESGLTASERAAVDRRKVSGDWRETPAGLSLVEVLALSPGPRAHAEPGFPVPGTFSSNGRQTALTASLGPDPDSGHLIRAQAATVDVEALAEALERRQELRTAASTARAELAAAVRVRSDRERAALAAALGQ
jgi:hypothetical protein